MIKIANLIDTLSHYLEAQRQLALCRQHALGDVDYYSYDYIKKFKQAETTLEQTLNDYLDERIAEKLLSRNLSR
jgi:hypothetical protein